MHMYSRAPATSAPPHAPKLSSTTRRMSSTGGSFPVKRRNWSAACPTNIVSPVTTVQPAAAASLQEGWEECEAGVRMMGCVPGVVLTRAAQTSMAAHSRQVTG